MKRQAAGVIPVFLKESGSPEYLILRVYKYWDFPKGEIEAGESPLACAKRELQEETGLSSARWTWGRGAISTEPYSGGKVAHYFLGEVREQSVRLSREHHAYLWGVYEDVRTKLGPRLQKVLDEAHARLSAKE